MIQSIHQTLTQFDNVIRALPEHSYNTSCDLLGGASIGAHTRHIIELYQCLIEGYADGLVCYDKRKRDKQIEGDVLYASACIETILTGIAKEEKAITIEYELHQRTTQLQSNYSRELMYNLEHTIHHQALIRIAIEYLTEIKLPTEFGVAPSTIQYRTACAQ